jgi:hypothetical protein
MQFTNQMDHLQSSIYQHMQSANKWSGRANTASGLANLAMAGASMMKPATVKTVSDTVTTNTGAQMNGTVVGVP